MSKLGVSAPIDSHDYASALAYLTSHPDMERGDRLPAELNLERTRFLLEGLGQPDRGYPSVLIAGTKGKGSTAAMMERALRAAGYRTGLYTQPHLHTTRERVRLNGEPIAPDDFAAGIQRVRAAAQRRVPSPSSWGQSSRTPSNWGQSPQTPGSGGRFTAYELMTSMALERFAEHQVDVAILEVGLGGRLDSTNVVDATLSVLTSISLDHTQILGNTLTSIAREKADIIKPGRPCISAPQHPDARAVIRATAAARGAPLFVGDDNGARWEPSPSNSGGWDLLVDGRCLSQVHLALRGGFQRTNSSVAATALNALSETSDLRVDLAALRIGLEDVAWAGRFEVVSAAPLTILDGAHNVESAQRLREALHEEYPGHIPVYVLGIASDKDLSGILQVLCSPVAGRATAPSPDVVVATAARHPRAAAPEALAGLAEANGADGLAVPSVAAALELAMPRIRPNQILVVTGSLHVVGEARVALGLADPTNEDPFDPWTTP